MIVGVISDTHGRLPTTVHAVMAGVERIIHAGDVGSQGVLDELETIAPVVAVRGNMDTGTLAWRLPEQAVVRVGDYRILVRHIGRTLEPSDGLAGSDVVVVGHTHRASVDRRGDVLFVNPGAAGGESRDGRGPTCALLDLSGDRPEASIVDL